MQLLHHHTFFHSPCSLLNFNKKHDSHIFGNIPECCFSTQKSRKMVKKQTNLWPELGTPDPPHPHPPLPLTRTWTPRTPHPPSPCNQSPPYPLTPRTPLTSSAKQSCGVYVFLFSIFDGVGVFVVQRFAVPPPLPESQSNTHDTSPYTPCPMNVHRPDHPDCHFSFIGFGGGWYFSLSN